jgi:hypothetical protein
VLKRDYWKGLDGWTVEGQRCRRSKMVWCGAGWPDQEGVKKNTANLYDGEDLKPRYTTKGKLGVSAAVRKVRWKPEQP